MILLLLSVLFGAIQPASNADGGGTSSSGDSDPVDGTATSSQSIATLLTFFHKVKKSSALKIVYT